MDDQQRWCLGIARLRVWCANISEVDNIALTHLLASYKTAKDALAAVTSDGAVAVCRECGGQCCQNGKYRMNVSDALACISFGAVPAADFAQKPLCPYGSTTGCSMAAGMRPADCITFICDCIDRLVSPQDRVRIGEWEQLIRDCIDDISRVTGLPVATPLLLWASREENISTTKE
ncbi:MAG: hypothetical protein PHY09_17595 [Desulfuromonadaceae bacterium]|nr:hypothetical protein [Desulfuromonadaceae bacterium]MDD5107828.1 hypothetical protein [Desulfuromonadaceae bacterium]